MLGALSCAACTAAHTCSCVHPLPAPLQGCEQVCEVLGDVSALVQGAGGEGAEQKVGLGVGALVAGMLNAKVGAARCPCCRWLASATLAHLF